ncbi:restriction endonuclease subunit S [Spongiibacter marinus]|uniref:restriction endonuclease subunit S n=1 Tax=Spongiibacter marinus TaxID=354246 RepID=UPI0035627208
MVWQVKKLSDICTDIFAGGDVPKDRLSKFKTEEYSIPIYSNGEKDKGLYGYTDVARVVEPSITVSARGTIGYSEVRREPFLPVVRLIVLIPNPEIIELEYLKYVLKGMDFGNSGTSIPQLTVPMIKGYQCELPPIPEQKRIVAILDQSFADIDKARALTEQNLKNARELFESYLQQVFSLRGEGWKETTIGDSCEFSNGKAHEKSIDEDGSYIVVNSKFISTEGAVEKRTGDLMHPLYKDDIAMVMSDVPGGKALAKCFVVPEDNLYSLNQRICSIKSNEFFTRFLYYQLNRNPYLLAYDNKGSQANLRKGEILSCPLFVPSLDEQKEIAERLDSAMDFCRALEAVYLNKLESLDKLKQSLLQKAFTGELIKVNKEAAA